MFVKLTVKFDYVPDKLAVICVDLLTALQLQLSGTDSKVNIQVENFGPQPFGNW